MKEINDILKKLTVTELAEKLGVARKTIYRWLSGECEMRLKHYIAVKRLYEKYYG